MSSGGPGSGPASPRAPPHPRRSCAHRRPGGELQCEPGAHTMISVRTAPASPARLHPAEECGGLTTDKAAHHRRRRLAHSTNSWCLPSARHNSSTLSSSSAGRRLSKRWLRGRSLRGAPPCATRCATTPFTARRHPAGGRRLESRTTKQHARMAKHARSRLKTRFFLRRRRHHRHNQVWAMMDTVRKHPQHPCRRTKDTEGGEGAAESAAGAGGNSIH